MNDRRRAATLFFKSVSCLPIFCFTAFISSSVLLLLMGGNINFKPGLILFYVRRQCDLERQISTILYLPQMGTFKVHLSPFFSFTFSPAFVLSVVFAASQLLQSPTLRHIFHCSSTYSSNVDCHPVKPLF